MAQTTPTYKYATGKSEKPIVDVLIEKYGFSNVTWPIVLIKNNKTIAYLYEKNSKNELNLEMDSRPGSKAHLSSYYLNFVDRPRSTTPQADFLKPFIQDKYSCSYDYVVESAFSTVDLDYVWYNGKNYKGFELTTFYMNFTSHARALELIAKMQKRPSWNGPDGAHAFHRIVDSATDLGVDYYVVCANTLNKVGSPLKTDGNVCLFPLTHEQVDLLQAGKAPNNSSFMPFREFISWL